MRIRDLRQCAMPVPHTGKYNLVILFTLHLPILGGRSKRRPFIGLTEPGFCMCDEGTLGPITRRQDDGNPCGPAKKANLTRPPNYVCITY